MVDFRQGISVYKLIDCVKIVLPYGPQGQIETAFSSKSQVTYRDLINHGLAINLITFPD